VGPTLTTCWACHNTVPSELTEEHHRAPRSAGGGDQNSNLVKCCCMCHTTVHAAARYLGKGNPGKARDTIRLLVKNDLDWGARLLELTQHATRAWKTGDQSVEQVISFKVPRGVYVALLGVSRVVHPKGPQGSAGGVPSLVRSIVLGWLERYIKTGKGW